MSQRASYDNLSGSRRVDESMRRALAVAAETRPHPNPRVGAVVFSSDGRIVAEHAHDGPPNPHAEAAALEAAGLAATGGTLVVTLEPCDHHGRRPPCTDAIIAAGITRVFVGVPDPDARVSGRGIARLRAAGIDVACGILQDEVEANDPGYFHHRRTGRPRITVKLAATVDGQTAASDGTSQWITSPEAREDAQQLRAGADAILVGAGTLRVDDPSLTVRMSGFEGMQPRPVVLAGQRPLPASAKVYGRRPLIYVPQETAEAPDGAEVVVMASPAGVDLHSVAKDLGQRDFVDVLVESGPTLAGALLECGLVDHLVLYLGAKLAGGVGRPLFFGDFSTLGAAAPVGLTDVRRVGPDIRIDIELTTQPGLS